MRKGIALKKDERHLIMLAEHLYTQTPERVFSAVIAADHNDFVRVIAPTADMSAGRIGPNGATIH